MARSNYKAKWQNALRQQQDDAAITAREEVHHIEDNKRINTDLNLAIQQISTVNGQITAAAADVIACLDESKNVAGLDFGEIHMEIDSKANKLPLHVSLRRTRDILKLVEARYAVLAIRAEELDEANKVYQAKIKSLQANSHLSTRTLLDNVWIGPHSTDAEREEYKHSRSNYKRYDLSYEDLSDDWLTTHVMTGTVIKERVPPVPDLSDDADSEIEDAKTRALTVSNNRLAVVTPMSPARKNMKIHSDLG